MDEITWDKYVCSRGSHEKTDDWKKFLLSMQQCFMDQQKTDIIIQELRNPSAFPLSSIQEKLIIRQHLNSHKELPRKSNNDAIRHKMQGFKPVFTWKTRGIPLQTANPAIDFNFATVPDLTSVLFFFKLLCLLCPRLLCPLRNHCGIVKYLSTAVFHLT